MLKFRSEPDQASPLVVQLLSRRKGPILLGVAIVAACGVLALVPEIDLVPERYFFTGGGFVGDTALGRLARDLARTIPFFILAALTFAWLAGKMGIVARFAPRGRSLLWLALSLALGPGLIVSGLKDISHRPRPVQLKQFGGMHDFRPYYRFDGGCRRNCSFPSGEASAAFWTLAPASLAPPPLRLAATGAAVMFGLAAGGLRLAFGGHFVSDVFFAGILTLGVGLGLHRLVMPRRRRAGLEKHRGAGPQPRKE